MSNLAQRLFQVRATALKPPTKLNLVEWADTYRYLSAEASSVPGRWKTKNVAVAKGPMLAFTDPSISKITVMACTQLMKTELINNIVGYSMHQDPCPMIIMQPTVSLAETWSKDRLDKMVRDTPVLNSLIKPKKSRDSGNTISHKSFAGGTISIVGSNSPTELASRPVRLVLCDEVDKYPESAGKEGDPIKLIQERSATFWNAKTVLVCSPTVKGRSRIEQEYEQSDMRVYKVPCPHCGLFQELTWSHVKWDNGDANTARIECEDCKRPWTETQRIEAISLGDYESTQPFKGHAGFKVNKLASPWEPLSKLVSKWLSSKDDQESLKTFINTQLAETWEEKGEAPEHIRLYERREKYQINQCPPGVVFLTAGCDVQKDRIELEIVGWGKGKESWSIDYRVIMGETSTDAPWLELDAVMNETWTLDHGVDVQIRKLAIDSGFNTQHVYNWARKYLSDRVAVVKGAGDEQTSIIGSVKAVDVQRDGSKHRRGLKVIMLGVGTLKSELYSFLNLKGAGDDGVYPNGYCHFPEYGEDYFKMLTAEQLVSRKIDGRMVSKWVKKAERNEALDCRNYARAAAELLGISRYQDKHWNALLQQGTVRTEVNVTQALPEKPPAQDRRVMSQPTPNSIWGNGKKKSIW